MLPYSCQSNILTTESTQPQPDRSMYFKLGETPVESTPSKQNEDLESSILLLEIPDNVTTFPDPELTIWAQCDPITNSSSKEIPVMKEEKSLSEDTLTATQNKACSETTEMDTQVPIAESDFVSDNDKQVECLVTRQNNSAASEISEVVSCPRMENVFTKEDCLNDKVCEDSPAAFNYHYSGDYLEGEREDEHKTSSQDCDISVSDVGNIYVANIDASEMTVMRPKTDESRSEPEFDLLVEENKMCISEEILNMDTVIQTSQNEDDSHHSETSSLTHFPKIGDGETPKKEDITLGFQHSTVSQDLDLMTNPTVECLQVLNSLSKSFATENVPLNQDPISKKPKPEFSSDQPSPTEHQGSCAEDQPSGVLIQTSQTVNETAELSTMVSWLKMNDGQKKQNVSLSSKNHKEDDSAEVFEKNDNMLFEDSESSQDCGGPVSATVDKIDMFHASSKASPETVSSRFFGFEELLPTLMEKPISDDKPKADLQYSEDSVTTMEVFETRTSLDSDLALSPSENEYCIPPGYDEVSTTFDYNAVQTKAASPTFELSDTEAYFDCKQGASDFSETESEDPESKLHQKRCHYPKEHVHFQQTLLLSDSEDSPFAFEPLYNVREENEDSSDEEFTLCEAPPKATFCETGVRDSDDDDDDTNESMSREMRAELGTLSESSDDEFLTTRIIRRRVIIKADEMADFPSQSTSEETYTDENGHTVVKKVTRRVIRKCASSSDDAGLEQVSSEKGAHSNIKASKGDGYSKVVKRTVVKSEGDQSEVTFTECESSLKQNKTEGGRASLVEKTVVLEGERTMTHQGDVSLASDLPSAQDDFKQAISYVSSFHDTELPHVVQRETVEDDGTLVKRAQMRKGRLIRRTVVKGAGQRKLVLSERVEGPTIGSKSSDLKQHLHKLFHRYNEQNHREDKNKENT